jgi:hypothetical protein
MPDTRFSGRQTRSVGLYRFLAKLQGIGSPGGTRTRAHGLGSTISLDSAIPGDTRHEYFPNPGADSLSRASNWCPRVQPHFCKFFTFRLPKTCQNDRVSASPILCFGWPTPTMYSAAPRRRIRSTEDRQPAAIGLPLPAELVTKRLGHERRPDRLFPCQVRDRVEQLEDAMVRLRAEAKDSLRIKFPS